MRRRVNHNPYADSRTPHYLVLRDMQRNIIEFESVPAHADLRAAMERVISRLATLGWEPESDAAYGFVFLRKPGERCELALTARHPHDESHQGFNPFR